MHPCGCKGAAHFSFRASAVPVAARRRMLEARREGATTVLLHMHTPHAHSTVATTKCRSTRTRRALHRTANAHALTLVRYRTASHCSAVIDVNAACHTWTGTVDSTETDYAWHGRLYKNLHNIFLYKHCHMTL